MLSKPKLMYSLKNDQLEISVKAIGAELCKITSVRLGTEFMWNGNPEVWSGFSPVLFPIIGALKNGSYIYDNNMYSLPKHGFIRHNKDMVKLAQTDSSLTFILRHDNNLLKSYPFKFEFNIGYELIGNSIQITHKIKNCDHKTMYFSVGGHPAFKCPVFKDERYEDYLLEFECIETVNTHLINMDNGLISHRTQPMLIRSNTLQLSHDLFNKDALVFKDLKSRKVTLKSLKNGDIVTVRFPDFPFLGIWAKPEGDYVCIEPWLGIADSEGTDQNLETKVGILSLEPNNTFNAVYTIEINKMHLV